MNKAIIDLGTNTFHLLVLNEKNEVLYKESKAVKLGKGGINQGILLEEAIDRAIDTLVVWREKTITYGIEASKIHAFGTSAMRVAKNAQDLVKKTKELTDIDIQIISGDREAELIAKGVKQAVDINENALIVDIGGGSVEFILCNKQQNLWKRSFEIGGQRLMEMFMKSDPIAMGSVSRMNDYLREQLLPLMNACHQYQPTVMIGSSGSYDTINDIYYLSLHGDFPPKEQVAFDLPLKAFYEIYEKLLFSNREQRMAIKGMISLRVDMIVVAACLIRYLLQTIGIEKLQVSNYALKEGIMSEI